jgi:hypothetical protein
VDLPSKEGVTPLMAAAGVEFGDRVTRGRNRTEEGVLATMRCSSMRARTSTPAWSPSETRRAGGDVAGRGFAFNVRGRPSQVPSALAVPHQTALHGAAARASRPS